MTWSLGLNLAVFPLSIGILYDGHTVFEWTEDTRKTLFPSEELPAELSTWCKRIGISVSDFAAIGIVEGPGNYTGLRLGSSIAQAISQVSKAPIFGFPTGDAFIPQMAVRDTMCFVAIPARKRELHVSLFSQQNRSRFSPSMIVSVSDFLEMLNRFSKPISVVGPDLHDLDAFPHIDLCEMPLYGGTLAKMAFRSHQKGEGPEPVVLNYAYAAV